MNEEQKPLPADIQPPVIQPPDIQPPSPAPHQREQLLNEVLLHVAAQMRTALGGMHMAVSRLAPPDRRDGDAALDRDAAMLNRGYYALLRMANNLSNAPMLLSDEPFYKENADVVEWLAALPCGLGLGLPLCRRIAEGHGGRMVLDSRPDQGTSVTLALPDEMAEDTVEDVQFDYAGGFQPALVGLADALPYQAFLQKHSDD